MGCDIGQGYFIARPMPLRDVLLFLKTDVEASAKIDTSRMRIAG
jgi:EAL domain-containing protein (putative c-di-GMP-specific phosphodiesterase class I)